MAFNLTIGTERAQALQDSIQHELAQRGYSADADPVMAEYITIMLINNKTAEQITAELEDLIGASEYDPSFTEWLFREAAKKTEAPTEPEAPPPRPTAESQVAAPARDPPPHIGRGTNSSRGTGVYQQALSQALPTSSSPSQKRTASARSPSPNGQGPTKSRRMDLPTGPRAMVHRDGGAGMGGGAGPGRSLLERVGGRRNVGGHGGRDEIQARIDAVTHAPDAMGMGMPMNGMNMGMMPGMGMGMGPAMMAEQVVNPLALQEMMMNQMALIAQMANSMGMMNAQNQYGPNGPFPMMNGGFEQQGMFPPQPQQQQQQPGGMNRRGGAQGGRGRGRGGSTQWVAPHVNDVNNNGASTSTPAPSAPAVVTPKPVAAAAPSAPAPPIASPAPTAQATLGFTPPERPLSPTLCKFGLKCTNALCRWSHPSPVSTPESGVVLSNDPCEAGKDCKDKDCIKAHVSPAVANPSLHVQPHKVEPVSTKPPCRYGVACTRISSGCPFSHPQQTTQANNGTNSHFNQQCRFGAGCTRASCPFQHPPGRVLPSTFHRGLSTSSPVVSVPTPETGSIGAARESVHRSVVFNKPAPKAVGAGKESEKKEGEVEAVVPKETKTVEAAA